MKINCDFHTHSRVSLDGILPPEKLIAIAKKRGLSVVAVTDHNDFSGYTEAARSAGDMLIIPAAEYATEKGHILALFIEKGLDERFLTPLDDFHFKFDGVIDGIHQNGGLAVFAHPFKAKSRDASSREIFERVDGIEVFNGRAAAKFNYDANKNACAAAAELGLFFTAGSDSHTAPEIGNARITLDVSELTLPAVRAALLAKNGTVWGRDARVLNCATSAFTKQKKKRRRSAYPKAVAYIIAAAGLDFLKTIRLVRKNHGRYFVKEGVFVDDNN